MPETTEPERIMVTCMTLGDPTHYGTHEYRPGKCILALKQADS